MYYDDFTKNYINRYHSDATKKGISYCPSCYSNEIFQLNGNRLKRRKFCGKCDFINSEWKSTSHTIPIFTKDKMYVITNKSPEIKNATIIHTDKMPLFAAALFIINGSINDSSGHEHIFDSTEYILFAPHGGSNAPTFQIDDWVINGPSQQQLFLSTGSKSNYADIKMLDKNVIRERLKKLPDNYTYEEIVEMAKSNASEDTKISAVSIKSKIEVDKLYKKDNGYNAFMRSPETRFIRLGIKERKKE